MDEDPAYTSLGCLVFLRYAEAKAAYDRANSNELKHWEGSKVMETVQEIAFELVEEAMKKEASGG